VAGGAVTVAAVGVAAAGAATTVIGGSEVAEGGQDVVFGALGSDTSSVNVVRDFGYGGDEAAYNQAKGIVTTTAAVGTMILAPVAQTVSAASGGMKSGKADSTKQTKTTGNTDGNGTSGKTVNPGTTGKTTTSALKLKSGKTDAVGDIKKSSNMISKPNQSGVNKAEIVEGKNIVNNRINEMTNNMTEGEKSRTTYAAALVKQKDGSTEMWVSAAGKKGYVPPRIRGNDKVVINKLLDADSTNRFNDAEQTIMREANQTGTEIISIGATRDMCPACQSVARANGIIERVATPLKE
jgi:hypothetical protein